MGCRGHPGQVVGTDLLGKILEAGIHEFQKSRQRFGLRTAMSAAQAGKIQQPDGGKHLQGQSLFQAGETPVALAGQVFDMGDQLAEYVSSQNDRRFFREFFTVQRYDFFRTALIKVNLAHVKRGNPPIITLDPYIEVFEEGNELARPDWRLARDLVLIRMVERLYKQGWLGNNVDVIPESAEDETESA